MNTKDGFDIVRNRLLHNYFNDFYLYQNNILYTNLPLINFSLHLFSLAKLTPIQ